METSLKSPNGRGLHSQALDLLRFPLAVIVAMSHLYPHFEGVCTGDSCQTADCILNVLSNFFYSFLRLQSVPVYFFISGYVFFLGTEFSKDTYIRKLKNRVKTLLIPYFIWNTFAVISALAPYIPAMIKDPSILNLRGLPSAYWIYDNSVLTLSDNSWNTSMPVDVPLWFIRDLMIIVLCTPIIYCSIKKLRFCPVVFFGCIWFADIFFKPYSPFGFGSGLFTGFFFFSFGAYMSIGKKDMVSEFGRFFKQSMVLYPCLGALCMLSAYICPTASLAIKQFTVLAGLPFAYNLAVWLLQKGYCKGNAFLASASFFIYVSHYFTKNIINSAYNKLFHAVNPTDDIQLFVRRTTVLVIMIPFLLTLFLLMKRCTPRLLGVLTGRK